jgi:hypothetical protein
MIVDKFTLPDGTKHYQAFPTSTRELRRLFLVYGIDAWVAKYGGKYDILFAGGIHHVTDNRNVRDMSAKDWVKLATNNAPESSKLQEGYAFLWGGMKQYVFKDTSN